MNRALLFYFAILLFASGCSVKKYLPAGEKLYRGVTIKVKKENGVKGSTGSLKKQLASAARPTPNKFLLGQPYKVWWWYVIGQPKKEKGLKAWLRKTLGEPPILNTRVNAPVIAEDMQAFMENIGYFHSTVKGDTVNQGYFVKAIYSADIFPQYKIKTITWVSDSSALLKELDSAKRKTILKVGNPYNLNDVEAERSRLDLRLKTKGYYYFSPDYIMAYADSNIGNHEVNLFLNVKKTIPEIARHSFTINRITVFPNYTLLSPTLDTSKAGLLDYDNLLIRDTVHKFKPELFKRVITYRPGKIYSSKDQNTSLNRLINLGTFKFVKNTFEAVKDSGDPYRLNASYYLTPSKKKSFQAEIDGFSKDNSYIGSQVSVNWKNRNTFGEAELLTLKAYGSFEISLADSLKGNNNFRVGSDVSLTFPKYQIPFFHINESNLYPPKTNIDLGYELFIKESFYTQNIFHLNYEFDWKESSNKEHTLTPIAITLLNTENITDSFYKAALINPSILTNVYSEIILGSYYAYRYTSLNPLSKNQIYFNGDIDISGNVAGLITGAKTTREKSILNTPFAQYGKLDGELTYKKNLGIRLDWVNHLQIGIGLPYNNSDALPVPKQYIIGGSSSLRGFPVHLIGPGSYLPTANDIKFFQTIGGDYKLLYNSELRFPVAGKNLTGALFVDVGNIWTKDTTVFGPAGQLKKDFYKELSVSSGVGLRFDLSVLLLRLDLGIPLRKPYLPDGQRWVFNQIAFGDKNWRNDNLIINIAIGYPF
jgi:outer membrane protein insertion porin family